MIALVCSAAYANDRDAHPAIAWSFRFLLVMPDGDGGWVPVLPRRRITVPAAAGAYRVTGVYTLTPAAQPPVLDADATAG